MDVAQLIRQVANAEQPRAHDGAPSGLSAAGRALARLHVSERDVPAVLPLLTDGHADVRYHAVRVLARLPDDQLSPHVPALLPLLADPNVYVRRAVSRVLHRIGPRTVRVLRELRRSPGPYRRHALTGLAEVVGWNGLDPADQALVRRLIRIRAPRETPEPFEPDGQWYAVPTADQPAVLDALDLSDPMPVTMRLGRAAASTGYVLGGRVAYVTPVLDGWTLVFVWDGEFEDRTVALSRRFGAAHAYLHWDDYHGSGFASGWCVAERGRIVRCYVHQDEAYEVGDPLPAEQGRLLPHHDAPYDADVCHTPSIAARISVDPTALGPHTRVSGQPVMALTADGRDQGLLPGALPL
ncbi:MAG TPA: HEAT repeat domain-containing protein [Actinocatenispora sp.]